MYIDLNYLCRKSLMTTYDKKDHGKISWRLTQPSSVTHADGQTVTFGEGGREKQNLF